MPICSHIKPDGCRCERRIKPSDSYCYSHDPARAEERKRNASKAARAKLGEIPEIKKTLRKLADDVLAGDLDRADASVAAQVLGVLARYVEIERRFHVEELEARLEELEALAYQRRRGFNAPRIR